MVIYLLISFIIVTGIVLIFVLIVPRMMSRKLILSQFSPSLCISDNLKILAVNHSFLDILNPEMSKSDISKSDKFIELTKVIDESIASGHPDTTYWSLYNGKETLNFLVNIQPVTLGIMKRCFLIKLILQKSKFDDIYFEVIHKLVHDLKSPLSTAMISLQNLKFSRDENGGAADSVNADIEDYVQPALDAIEDIKKFANILSMMSNTTQNNYSACDFVDLAERVLSQITDDILNGVTLVREIEEKLPPVYINKREMELALKNIVLNRIKSMDGKGKIHISIKHLPSRNLQKLLVSIQDTKNEDLQSVITPKISDKNIGFYKDLLIAMRMLEKHGSHLIFEMIENKGSKLSFEINSHTENGKIMEWK